MHIYPTLTDLCGVPTPAHVQGQSLRALLANPQMPWTQPAITTYRQSNHSIRSEDWRYTRYADGGEELYDEQADPFEWTNLALQAGAPAWMKTNLAKMLPTENKLHATPPPAQASSPQARREASAPIRRELFNVPPKPDSWPPGSARSSR